MVFVFKTYLDSNPDRNTVVEAIRELPADWQDYVQRFKQPADQLRSAKGRKLLMLYYAERYGPKTSWPEIAYKHGRPYFPALPDCHFSISHSGTCVVLASTDGGQVGIDVEQVREIDTHSFQQFFGRGERDAIEEAQNDSACFFRLWCRKEALAKALGKGLFAPLKELDVRADNIDVEGTGFYIEDIKLPQKDGAQFVCAIAYSSLSKAQVLLKEFGS